MSKVNCPCGTQLSDVGYPCPNKAALVTDVVFDEAETRERTVSSDVVLDSRDVWECYECGRLAIDHPESGSNRIKWYVPADGIRGDVMKHPWKKTPVRATVAHCPDCNGANVDVHGHPCGECEISAPSPTPAAASTESDSPRKL